MKSAAHTFAGAPQPAARAAAPMNSRAHACPVCREARAPLSLCPATLGYGSAFELVECRGCGVRYLDPAPTEEQLAHFYAPHYYGTDWYKQQGWGMAYAKTFLRGQPPGKFLDVGCGLGYFIDGVRKHSGWDVAGVEFSPRAVEYARRELGLDVRRGDLQRANFPAGQFDRVQIRNVLEHVTDPVGLLREVRRVLKDDGTFHLFVPNGTADSQNLVTFYERERRPPLSQSGHLFFFPRRALLRMFDETGFVLERAGTYGIRRGLTNLGLWPRKKNWKRGYESPEGAPPTGDAEISLPPKKERPDLYYRYRQWRMRARTLPGMRDFGLDFELTLRPKN